LNPQGAKHWRILREGIQSTCEYYRVLLSASDADVTKIGLLSNALQCYSFRLLPVTKASQTLNHRSGDEKALVTISDPDPRACVGESQFRDGYESGRRFEGGITHRGENATALLLVQWCGAVVWRGRCWRPVTDSPPGIRAPTNVSDSTSVGLTKFRSKELQHRSQHHPKDSPKQPYRELRHRRQRP